MSQQSDSNAETTRKVSSVKSDVGVQVSAKVKTKAKAKEKNSVNAKAKSDITPDISKKEVRSLSAEQDKHKMLILFRASDTSKNAESQFYILGGNSAVIFAGDIGEKLGRTPKLRPDMDNGEYKFENGVVFVRNIGKLMTELEKIGLKRQKLSKQWADDEIVCYLPVK